MAKDGSDVDNYQDSSTGGSAAVESVEMKAVAMEEASPNKPSIRGNLDSPPITHVSSSVVSSSGGGASVPRGDDRTGSGFAIAEEVAALRRAVEEGNMRLREEIAAL